MSSANGTPRLLTILMGASFLLNLAFALYRGVFNNFAVQEMGIDAARYGLVEGIREVPGLLTVVLVAMAARVRDERLYAISGSLVGIGIWLYATANSYADVVLATLVQSTGFHVWSVVQESIVLKHTALEDRATRLGKVNAAGAAAGLLGLAGVWLTGSLLNIRWYFVMAGVVGLGGAALGLLLRRTAEAVHRPTFVFRWQYRSYYVLTLLQGARRHIVVTFASFALVKLYGASVPTMALLMALQSFLAIWTRPLIGRIIDRVGEQRALSLNYGIVAAVFAGYAFIRVPWIAYGLFVMDNVLTGFDIAVSTHAGRIIPRGELSASLATGSTINHIFGVMVPIAGGFMWELFGPVIPFLMGVTVVLIGMAYSWNLDARTKAITGDSVA